MTECMKFRHMASQTSVVSEVQTNRCEVLLAQATCQTSEKIYNFRDGFTQLQSCMSEAHSEVTKLTKLCKPRLYLK